MSKDTLMQCLHEAAAKHGTPSISSISLQCERKLGFNFVEQLWYGRSWPWSQSERGKSNLEWKKNTFILSNYNELVDILSSEMETSWHIWYAQYAKYTLCAIRHIDLLGLSIFFCILLHIVWHIYAQYAKIICQITWIAHTGSVYFACFAYCNMQTWNMQNMQYNMQQYTKKYA